MKYLMLPVPQTVFRFLYLCMFVCLGFVLPQAAPAEQMQIVSWAPVTADWQRTLHISALRVGCSGQPANCVSPSAPQTRVLLSILLKPETVDYGRQYSALSLSNPWLAEVGLDDFLSQYEKLGNDSNRVMVLGSFINGLKSRNPNLQFGATIYEDDLDSQSLNDANLPAFLRSRFDVVHLFLHYRGDTSHLPEYVERAKSMFPKAAILGGVYAYDRISYLPCLPKGQPCSEEEEMRDFTQSLDILTKLSLRGTISGIEFYPGVFGREESWTNWKLPRFCTGPLESCVANTRKMDEAAAAKIGGLLN